MNKNVFVLLAGTGLTVLIFFLLLTMSIGYKSDNDKENPDIAGASDELNIATSDDDSSDQVVVEDVDDLSIETIAEGSGDVSDNGDTLVVHYTGSLLDGTKFDSSLDRGTPFEFVLGTGSVITGWEEGMKGMKVGEKRILVIPSDMGYGEFGSPPVIPGNAALKFEVELLEIK